MEKLRKVQVSNNWGILNLRKTRLICNILIKDNLKSSTLQVQVRVRQRIVQGRVIRGLFLKKVETYEMVKNSRKMHFQ